MATTTSSGRFVRDARVSRYGLRDAARLGAALGLYGNSKEEAYYTPYAVDADRQPLDGSKSYVLHFFQGSGAAGQVFLWSMTRCTTCRDGSSSQIRLAATRSAAELQGSRRTPTAPSISTSKVRRRGRTRKPTGCQLRRRGRSTWCCACTARRRVDDGKLEGSVNRLPPTRCVE